MTNILNWFKTNFFKVEDEDSTKERKIDWKRLLGHFLVGFLVFIFIYLSYTIIKPLNKQWNTPDGAVAKAYGVIIFFVMVVSYIILWRKKKLNFEINVFYIIALALLIHLVYMLYTSGTTRQHDTWSTNANGHYDYAHYIYDHFSLPNHTFSESDVYQFYHPPLYYYVSAIWMHIYKVIGFNSSLTSTPENLFCSVQILSTFFTFLIVWYAIKTVRLFNLKKIPAYLAIIFVAMFPRLMQFSGQLNNDVLANLFIICSIFRFFKYKLEGNSYKDILLCGLYLGLGMMTKLSAVIVCLGFAAYFIYEFVRALMKKEDAVPLKKMAIQYVSFLVICASLGLWFQLYAHNVYGLPFNFVFRSLNSKLFVGTRDYVLTHTYLNVNYYDNNNSGILYENNFVNFLVRYLLPFYPPDSSSGIFVSAFDNYNILTYAIKTSIFGEFRYYNGEGFGLLAIISAYILWFSIIVSMVYFLIKKKTDTNLNFAWGIVLSIVVFYLYLQYSMPYGCSMDARYIAPILLPIGLIIGFTYTKLDKEKKFDKVLMILIMGATITFAASSFGFYAFAI